MVGFFSVRGWWVEFIGFAFFGVEEQAVGHDRRHKERFVRASAIARSRSSMLKTVASSGNPLALLGGQIGAGARDGHAVGQAHLPDRWRGRMMGALLPG
jgi:hypothetical protein